MKVRAWQRGAVTRSGLRRCTVNFQGFTPSRILSPVSIHKPRIGNTPFLHTSVDKCLGCIHIFQVHIWTLLPLQRSCLFSLWFNFIRTHQSSDYLQAIHLSQAQDQPADPGAPCWLGAPQREAIRLQPAPCTFWWQPGNSAIPECAATRWVKIFGLFLLMRYYH